MSALNGDLDQTAVNESAQVHGRGGRRHAGQARQFAGRQGSTVSQRDKHRHSGRIAEQRSNGRQIEVARLLSHPSSMTHARYGLRHNVPDIASRPPHRVLAG